jgi:hypothetical protein
MNLMQKTFDPSTIICFGIPVKCTEWVFPAEIVVGRNPEAYWSRVLLRLVFVWNEFL